MRETRMIQARRLTMILPAMTLADIHDFPSPAPVSRFAIPPLLSYGFSASITQATFRPSLTS
jgi:hypothetical protein